MEWDEITLAGRGPGTRYVIPPLLRRYIEKMEEATPDLLDAYWLVPGKLIFGDPTLYFENAADQEWERQEIREMLAYGVDGWLDVQVVSPGEAARENPLFAEEARAAGRAVIHEVVALEIQYSGKEIYPETRRGRPNRRDIRPVLDKIDGFLAGGRVVYVSAANSALRGVLAGCFLARHGQGGAEALAALQLRRAESAKGWRREPVSRRARRFIRRWPAGL